MFLATCLLVSPSHTVFYPLFLDILFLVPVQVAELEVVALNRVPCFLKVLTIELNIHAVRAGRLQATLSDAPRKLSGGNLSLHL